MNILLGLLSFGVLLLVVALVSYLVDQRRWNGGVCRKNGLPWSSMITADGRVLLTAGGERCYVARWMLKDEYLQ